MRFKFTGNFKALKAWKEKIAQLPEALDQVNEALCEEAIELVREGFEQQRDPDGVPWMPHAALTERLRPGGRILEDDGHLKAGWHRRFVDRKGFGLGNAQKTAEWAQKGTGIHGPRKRAIRPINGTALRIPTPGGAIFLGSIAGQQPRQMVPEGKRLPTRWKNRFVETAQDVLVEIFRG